MIPTARNSCRGWPTVPSNQAARGMGALKKLATQWTKREPLRIHTGTTTYPCMSGGTMYMQLPVYRLLPVRKMPIKPIGKTTPEMKEGSPGYGAGPSPCTMIVVKID